MSEKISPLDPDFLVFAFPLAIMTDIVDIFLESLIVTHAFAIGVDFIDLFVLGGWMYYRFNRIEQAKTRKNKGTALTAAKLKNSGQQLKSGKSGVKFSGRRSPLGRVFWREGIAFLLELTPLISALPFQTIAVIACLGISEED